MPAAMRGFINYFGVLRLLLLALTLLTIAAAPLAGGPVQYHDWRIVPTLIAPVVMVMLVFALPLELLMTRIFMLDEQGAARRRLRTIALAELGALVALLLAWWPFLSGLLL